MERGLTDRRLFVEQQLFDVEVRLERARNELELAEGQLHAVSAQAVAAEKRRAASEIPVADRDCAAAQERLTAIVTSTDHARRLVRDLEHTRDGLFAKLVG
jgi:hypothetical protein